MGVGRTWLSKAIFKLHVEIVKVQDRLLKKINNILRICFSLVLSLFELLLHQRDKSTVKHDRKIIKRK